MTTPVFTIPVEVKGEFGEHYPANAVKLFSDGVLVTFQCHQGNLVGSGNDHEVSKPSAQFNAQTIYKYPFENVRSVPTPSTPTSPLASPDNPSTASDYSVGDQVEVWYTVNLFASNGSLVTSPALLPESTNPSESALFTRPPPQPMAWWEARVTKITKELLGMEIIVTQPGKDGASPITLRCTEIVDRNQVRRKNDQPHWNADNFHSRSITLTGCHVSLDDPSLLDFVRRLSGHVLVECNEDGHLLTFFSPDRIVIRRVGLLEDSFIRLMQQKMSMMPHSVRRSEEREKGLTEVFSVPSDLIGMALGHHGRNIDEARGLPGIFNIFLDDVTKTFYVHGETRDAVKNARELLEYMRDMIFVPQACVGRIIGQKGALLQEVIDKSQVIRVYVGGTDKEGTNIVFPNGVVAPVQEGYLPFQVVGRRSQLEDARLMIEFQIDLLQEIDRQTAAITETREGSKHSLSGMNGGPSRLMSAGSSDMDNRENSLPPSRRGAWQGGSRGTHFPPRGRGRGGRGDRRDYDHDDMNHSERRSPPNDSSDYGGPHPGGYSTDSALYDGGSRGRGGRGRYRARGGRGSFTNGRNEREHVPEEDGVQSYSNGNRIPENNLSKQSSTNSEGKSLNDENTSNGQKAIQLAPRQNGPASNKENGRPLSTGNRKPRTNNKNTSDGPLNDRRD
jgi:hypothetical protein